jgi:hypothetical protein
MPGPRIGDHVELFGCAPSPGALAAAAKKTAGLLAPALATLTSSHRPRRLGSVSSFGLGAAWPGRTKIVTHLSSYLL